MRNRELYERIQMKEIISQELYKEKSNSLVIMAG